MVFVVSGFMLSLQAFRRASDRVELLEVENLRTTFRTEDGPVTAVNGLSFSLDAGETLGIVGESGSGKSVTALSIMRLLPRNATVTADRIAFHGESLPAKSEAEMRKIRGHRIAMIFQDPMTSLNPVLTIGEQIAEAVRLHLGLDKREARDRVIEMLEQGSHSATRKSDWATIRTNSRAACASA